ncbi:MAG TPA: EamA family transporter RarD [Caulobacteraceae bacterium]|nr:EamA family transporter RarD [Caulobacteraceae bacterium]
MSATPTQVRTASTPAIAAGLACNLLWGSVPILFIALGRMGASSWEIVAQRCLWAAPCAGAVALLLGQRREILATLRRWATVRLLIASALAISTGWSVYVWAVDNGHNLDASLGYYITPLLNMGAGAMLFGERIDRYGAAAIALAAVGVAIQALALGHIPLISLVLATTFWVYGLIRRHVAVSAIAGLFIETLVVAGPGAAYVAWLALHHQGVFGHALAPSLWMLLVGPATVAPLAIFAWTARRLPFSVLGFLQFVSPTVGFVVGLGVGETLSPLRLISFAFIWAGVAAFSAGAVRAGRRLQIAA